MEWQKGYTASYYMTIIDPITWRDIERIEITGGEVQREIDGLRAAANVNAKERFNQIERWVRIWFDAEQSGANEHVALFTGLATSPGQQFDGVRSDNSVECYSVLKPVEDVDLLRGWYAPAGANGASIIKELLSVTPAPLEIAEDSPTLANHIIAEDQENHLTMVEKILTAINWSLNVLGDGSIVIGPKNNNSVAVFDPLEYDVLETKINVEQDWFNCPNVFMVISDEITAIARDESETSPLSVVNRGREVWQQEDGCDLSDQENAQQYASRRLTEAQQVQKKASYDRRFIPNIYPGNYITMRYPEQNVDGVFKVQSQSIELSYAARTSEEIIQ